MTKKNNKTLKYKQRQLNHLSKKGDKKSNKENARQTKKKSCFTFSVFTWCFKTMRQRCLSGQQGPFTEATLRGERQHSASVKCCELYCILQVTTTSGYSPTNGMLASFWHGAAQSSEAHVVSWNRGGISSFHYSTFFIYFFSCIFLVLLNVLWCLH